MKANIGKSEHNKQSVSDELSKILADEYVLSGKIEFAHWIVESKGFYEKRKLFEAQMNCENNDSQGFIHELLMDHKLIIMNLRENIQTFADKFHDIGSSDFITGLMEDHEKMVWFLRAHLLSQEKQIDKKSEIQKMKKQLTTF